MQIQIIFIYMELNHNNGHLMVFNVVSYWPYNNAYQPITRQHLSAFRYSQEYLLEFKLNYRNRAKEDLSDFEGRVVGGSRKLI